MIKADIKFRDGSIHTCVGRVVNGKSVPWTSKEDAIAHVRSIEGLEVVRFR